MSSKTATYQRPPIVTIMGHVDHGKTSLLDAIRHSRITDKEFGGITQHIGAYQVAHGDRKITFIDTPGHAAFAKMRARGASVTDVIVLVVAADDGVKPQTVESISHIKKAQLPVIVAINKMDVPGASPDMVKSQLTQYEIFCEGYGGQTPCVNVSARKQEGITELLDMIVLVADLEELPADPEGTLEAVVIESNLDAHRGPIGTVIVRNGTLKAKTTYYYESQPVKFRSLINDLGQPIAAAPPGTPVELMGFNVVPAVGSILTSDPELSFAPIVPQEVPVPPAEDASPDAAEDESPPPRVNVILKADTAGTLEAIRQNVADELVIIDAGVGPVNESDVLLADSTGAFIIGFNVSATTSANRLAREEKVKIVTFTIIYELLEFLEKKVLELLEPSLYEEELGVAEVQATFLIRGERIAGCTVKSGKINKQHPLHLVRRDRPVKDIKVKSLKRGKDDIDSAKEGTEFGLISATPVDFRVGDVIKSYRIIEK
jgi:translation initiation factor IF-2